MANDIGNPTGGHCILCRNPSRELTEEHIFPDAAGGSIKKFILCKRCNSRLGTKIDAPYVNQPIVQLARAALGIKGRAKRVPSPFSTVHEIDAPIGKLQIKLDSQFRPVVQPRAPEVSVTEDGKVVVSLSRDLSQKNSVPKTVRTTLQRFFRSTLGKSLNWTEQEQKQAIREAVEAATNADAESLPVAEMLHEQWTIELDKIFAEQAKVIYEVCSLEFGDKFLNSAQAGEFRAYLTSILNDDAATPSLEDVSRRLSMANVIPPSLDPVIKLFTDGERHKYHIVIVTASGVVCSMLGMGATLALDSSVADINTYIGRIYRCNVETGSSEILGIEEHGGNEV